MVLGIGMAIFDWEWGQNLAPREGQKIPWILPTVDNLLQRVWIQIRPDKLFETVIKCVGDFGSTNL